MTKLTKLILERRLTLQQRLQQNGFKFQYYTPVNNFEVYSNVRAEIIYDPIKNKVLCGRMPVRPMI